MRCPLKLKSNPVLIEGKKIVCKNAIKHGILSNSLSDYDKIQYNELYKQLANEFKVRKTYQVILLEQLVLCYMKLARCARFESEIMNESLRTKVIHGVQFGGLEEDMEFIDDKDRAQLDEKIFKKLELVLIRYEPQLVKRLMNLTKQLSSLK